LKLGTCDYVEDVTILNNFWCRSLQWVGSSPQMGKI